MYPVKLLMLPCLFLCCNALSQTGKDGTEIISSSNVIFNRYDRLASTAAAGDFSITINNIANLSGSAISGVANNPYASNALTAGDLLMIIKMQGATIDTTNSASYGAIKAYNNVGVYELAAVQSVSGNTIILSAALANSFVVSAMQRTQVVRIPRLSSLTINGGASLTGQAWSGSYTGGIVAVEVTGNAIVNGTITADGIGYRGGAIDPTSSDLQFAVRNYKGTVGEQGAEKGESIAGYQADYDILLGRFCKGAPANGGGGGNAHNSGGGGGANGGNPATWDGKGNPDLSGIDWYRAWDLEGSNFSQHTSSGGGRGGYSFSNSKMGDALKEAPGTKGWGGDSRQNEGGLGGRPLSYTANTLFMGGGGGAGDQNSGLGTAGGNGGGIIYLTITGTLSGTGNINANGSPGGDVTGIDYAAPTNGLDAAGGGGGGGAIKLNVLSTISGVGLYGKGGKGGNQKQFKPGAEAQGPGGGGGGGYIAVTGAPSIIMNAAAGVNGITNSAALTEFLPNGATMGASGSVTTNISYQIPPPQIPLPLRFLSFSLQSGSGNKIVVNWIVANEKEVVKYDLEQNTGDGNWKFVESKLASAEIAKSKQYSIAINNPFQTVFYRLKMVTKNGSFLYSAVRVFKPTAENVSLKNNVQSVQVLGVNQSVHIRLFNSFGQEVKFNGTENSGVITIDKSSLSKGVYYLLITSADMRQTYRFVH